MGNHLRPLVQRRAVKCSRYVVVSRWPHGGNHRHRSSGMSCTDLVIASLHWRSAYDFGSSSRVECRRIRNPVHLVCTWSVDRSVEAEPVMASSRHFAAGTTGTRTHDLHGVNVSETCRTVQLHRFTCSFDGSVTCWFRSSCSHRVPTKPPAPLTPTTKSDPAPLPRSGSGRNPSRRFRHAKIGTDAAQRIGRIDDLPRRQR